MGDLDFGAVEATASVEVISPTLVYALVAGTLVLWILAVAGSTWLALARGTQHPQRLTVAGLRPAHKLVVGLSLSAGVGVQLMAAASVWSHTQDIHGSAQEYFQYLSAARLFGMSHAHLFGFAVLYGFNGALLAMTSHGERLKCLVISTICWSGVFDVGSWWGLRQVASEFEWVSIATGTAAAVGWIASAALIAWDLGRKGTS